MTKMKRDATHCRSSAGIRPVSSLRLHTHRQHENHTTQQASKRLSSSSSQQQHRLTQITRTDTRGWSTGLTEHFVRGRLRNRTPDTWQTQAALSEGAVPCASRRRRGEEPFTHDIPRAKHERTATPGRAHTPKRAAAAQRAAPAPNCPCPCLSTPPDRRAWLGGTNTNAENEIERRTDTRGVVHEDTEEASAHPNECYQMTITLIVPLEAKTRSLSRTRS